MSQQSTPTSLNEQAQGGLFTLLVIKLVWHHKSSP